MSTATCPRCKNLVSIQAKFCRNCGNELRKAAPATVVLTSPSSKQPAQTAPLPLAAITRKLPTVAEIPVLAPDTLLSNGRYKIINRVTGSMGGNSYLALDTQVRRCLNCGYQDAQQSRFCEDCGKPLVPNYYVLYESIQPAEFEHVRSIVENRLHGPGLVNIYDLVIQPGQNNHLHIMIVTDPIVLEGAIPSTRRAESLAQKQNVPLTDALTWATQLADTLDTLHRQGYAMPALNLADTWLLDGRIRLAGLHHLRPITPTIQNRVAAEHVRGLASILENLLGDSISPAIASFLDTAAAPGGGSYPSATAFVTALSSIIHSTPRSPEQPAVQTTPQRAAVPVLRAYHAALSDVGHVREVNEDSLLAETLTPSLKIFAVADGMGGHAAGEVASRIAVETLHRSLAGAAKQSRGPTTDFAAMLKQACLDAAREVHRQGQTAHLDMGTTLVAALVAGKEIHVANIGDSRLYALENGKLRQVTTDHSLAELLVSRQAMSREEANRHPQGNQIYRSLGAKAVVEVDLFRLTAAPGLMLLLCSDGLSGLVDDADIQRTLLNTPSLQAACEKLIALANNAGGHDNITAIVIKFENSYE